MLLSPQLTLALVMAAPLQIGEVPPPTLNAGSLAIVGEELTFVLEGTTVVPAVTELLLIDFALLPAPVQIAPYGDFFLAIGPGFEVIPGDGTSAWKIPIPNDPALVGLPIHAQALGFVYQAFFGAVKLSNLASVEIQAEPPGAARIAVVANLEDGSLTFQGVDVEGARSRHIGVHLEDDSARALAATSDGSRLFAVDSSNERLVTFEVDGGTGAWNRLGDAPTGALPLDVVVDPSDRFVYAANALDNSISQYALDANGLPQPLTPAELATSSTPSSISIDPSGRWLFAVAAASNLILVHAIDSATGALSLQSAFPIDGSPARLAIGHGGTVVHVLNPASNSITSWSFDTETGQIGALIGQPVAAPPGAVDLTMGSEQKHLYVVDSASSELLWFDVSDEDGGLAPTPEGSVPTAEGSLAVVADPRGERLFVTGIGSNELWIHAPEEATGNPIFVQRLRQRGLPADVVLLLGSQPTAMQSRLVLVGHEGSDEIRAYQLDKELGVIVDLGAGAMTSGPGHVGLALDRRTGSLISAEEQGGVGGYLFNTENGDLTGTGQAASGTQPTDVAIDPTGRFAWTSEAGNDALRRFDLTLGPPTEAGTIPLAPGSTPGPLAISPQGRWLVVAGTVDQRLTTFRVQADGGLVESASTLLEGTALDIAISTSGRFVLVAERDPDQLSVYRIDPGLGAPVLVGSSSAGSDPIAVAIDPTDRFAYVANAGSKNLSIFELDPATAAPGPKTSQGLAESPTALAIDGSGEVLIVSESSIDLLQMFTIDPGDGGLSGLGMSLAGGQGPATLLPALELD